MPEPTRRLAAILAADVVGYSAMVGADETTTLARVRALRTEVIEPGAAEHQGRLFKTLGDGFLLEFASAVQALRCAIVIQEHLNAQPNGLRLRIGIHQGEVVPEGDDLFGDGVILAARLEPLAEPGGIVISSRVKEDASGKMALETDDLGEPALKNIAAKVHAWRVRLARATTPPPALTLPEKPSIAVLPFKNMSGDLEQEYFADGMSEDIITELSRFRALFVIARNSTFTYKGKSVDVRDVARELGVRYVLEGSVRKAGNRARITAQLIDALTGNHLWAERYDRSMDDVFAVQEDVTRNIVAAVAPQVELAEIVKGARVAPDEDAAHDVWRLKGMWHQVYQLGQPSQAMATIAAAERALITNPTSLEALFVLGMCHSACHLNRWGADPARDLDAMWSVAERMQAIDGLSDLTLTLAGMARVTRGEHQRGIADLRLALEANPNSAAILGVLSWAEATTGLHEDAKDHASLATRLTPVGRGVGAAFLALAMATFSLREYADAMQWAQRAIQMQSRAPIRRAIMIACCALAGEMDHAARERTVLDGFAPDFLASLFRGENKVFHRQEDMAHLLDGLRAAGVVR